MRQLKRSLSMILLFALVAVIFRAGVNYKMVVISAPELFDTGDLHTISLRSISLGFIVTEHTWLYIEYRPTNARGQCMIFPSKKALGDAQPIYCEKYYHPSRKYFQGFIYFRGHERKFCGGNFIPSACLKIGDSHG